jgi:sensor histidine kinase YesM
VENAVKHGFQDSAGPATIRIAAARNNGDLVLEVADSGRGFGAAATPAPPPEAPNGVGLSNTRQRLAEMYGARAELRLGRAPEGGALVTVLLPFEAGGEAAVHA